MEQHAIAKRCIKTPPGVTFVRGASSNQLPASPDVRSARCTGQTRYSSRRRLAHRQHIGRQPTEPGFEADYFVKSACDAITLQPRRANPVPISRIEEPTCFDSSNRLAHRTRPYSPRTQAMTPEMHAAQHCFVPSAKQYLPYTRNKLWHAPPHRHFDHI